MFILRRIALNGEETNQVIGEAYTIYREEETKDLFLCVKNKYGIDNSDGDIYAFLIGQDPFPIPIYKKSKYYIMTESGKTFATLIF